MNIKMYKTTAHIVLIATVVGALALTVVYTLGSQVSAAPVDVLKVCDSASKVCDNVDGNSLFGIITNIINLLLAIIGIIAVIMIVIGGFRYTTSAGDPGQTKSARDTIVYAVVGLVIAIMAYGIVNFVISRL